MLALKFIIDVGVGYLVDQWLVQNGYDVISVRDLNPSMDDEDILSLAVAEDRMVVTMDKDFGELVYKEGSLHAGILILRLEGAASAEKIRVFDYILQNYGEEIPFHFCVFQNGKLRIRPNR